jgi:hypothetical protein
MPQGLDVELCQTGERLARLSCREHERDLLRQQAASHERKHLRRSAIQPLRVIDDGQQRPLLGCLRQQAEDRQSDEERIRSRSGTESERDAKRVTLRLREMLRELKERAQLLGRGVRSSISDSTPNVRANRNSRPASIAYSSSAVLPTPGSPRTTNTPPCPLVAASSSRSSASRSRSRPSNRRPGKRTGDSTPLISIVTMTEDDIGTH